MRTLVVTALLALSAPALAQDTAEVTYKPVTELDFDTIELNVPLTRPSGVLLAEVARPKFNPLIRLRTSWDPELRGSVGAIQ